MEQAIKEYSRIKKISKTHRSVLDRSRNDIIEIAQSIPLHNDNKANTHIKDEAISKLLNKMISM